LFAVDTEIPDGRSGLFMRTTAEEASVARGTWDFIQTTNRTATSTEGGLFIGSRKLIYMGQSTIVDFFSAELLSSTVLNQLETTILFGLFSINSQLHPSTSKTKHPACCCFFAGSLPPDSKEPVRMEIHIYNFYNLYK
jgi:hypothetical protein